MYHRRNIEYRLGSFFVEVVLGVYRFPIGVNNGEPSEGELSSDTHFRKGVDGWTSGTLLGEGRMDTSESTITG